MDIVKEKKKKGWRSFSFVFLRKSMQFTGGRLLRGFSDGEVKWVLKRFKELWSDFLDGRCFCQFLSLLELMYSKLSLVPSAGPLFRGLLIIPRNKIFR